MTLADAIALIGLARRVWRRSPEGSGNAHSKKMLALVPRSDPIISDFALSAGSVFVGEG